MTDKDVQQVYDVFWKEIIEPNGEIDFEQVKKELFDFYTMIDEVPKVYDAVTGGRISKPLTKASVVIDEADEHYKNWYAEDNAAELAALRERVAALEAICDQATTDCIPLLSWVADDDAAVEMVMNIANNLGAATAEGGE